MNKQGDDAFQGRWLEISVDLAAEFAEPVTHLFSRYGDGRVFVSQFGDWDADDTGSNPEMNGNVTVFCYLKIDDTLENRKGMIDVGLRLMSEIADVSSARERVVSEQEWANQSFPEIRVGERIVISPWMLEDGMPEFVDTEDVRIFLSPGLAFGTGNHPTTRLCLKQIERESANGKLSDKRILDVGCGSGILSIAAMKMGATEAWCLDVDETAIRAVHDNTQMSDVSGGVHILHGSVPNADLPGYQFDYVFANITSRVLIDIADALIDKTNVNGTLLASGILNDQVDAVIEAFTRHKSMSIDETYSEDDWGMLRMCKVAAG